MPVTVYFRLTSKYRGDMRQFLGSICIAGAFILSGCATSPIPREIRRQVTPGLTFGHVLRSPEAQKGKIVLWGGQILSLKNAKDGTTLHLLEVPTDSDGRPINPEASEGRFIAAIDRYLDMAVYQRGRLVTIFGEGEGARSEPLGEGQMEYAYPVIHAREIYLWPRNYPAHVLYADPWMDPYGEGFGGPDWRARFGLGYSFPMR
jgi:outer membrane lipoprotein